MAEKTHCKLLAALPSAGKVCNTTEHSTRTANLQDRNTQLYCGGNHQDGSTDTDTNSTGLERSFGKYDGGITSVTSLEGFKSNNASVFNIGASLAKFKASSNKLDDDKVNENEIKFVTEENFVKIECDNLKIEYEVDTFNRNDGNTETDPADEIKREEKVPEDLLTESDDENVPLVSMKSMDRCRKRKIVEMEKNQCGNC